MKYPLSKVEYVEKLRLICDRLRSVDVVASISRCFQGNPNDRATPEEKREAVRALMRSSSNYQTLMETDRHAAQIISHLDIDDVYSQDFIEGIVEQLHIENMPKSSAQIHTRLPSIASFHQRLLAVRDSAANNFLIERKDVEDGIFVFKIPYDENGIPLNALGGIVDRIESMMVDVERSRNIPHHDPAVVFADTGEYMQLWIKTSPELARVMTGIFNAMERRPAIDDTVIDQVQGIYEIPEKKESPKQIAAPKKKKSKSEGK